MQFFAVWATTWVSFAFYMIVLSLFSFTACGDSLETSASDPRLPSKLPCPDADIIDPCHCSYVDNTGMEIDCSAVSSEDELKSIFSHNFSFSNFKKLTIRNNHNITTFREGDFGSASFAEIMIEASSLSEVQSASLKGSYHTLNSLVINFCKLSSVPDISNFTCLETLKLWGNQITKVPIQFSATLSTLDLSRNLIDDISNDAIIEMTALEKLVLNSNSLTEIHPETFTRNKNLNYLDIGGNKLTTIPNHAIALYGENTSLILNNNQITNFPYGEVSSITEGLDVGINQLSELPEHIFRPLLERFVNVELYDNPFKCGCDIAWLIVNQDLLQRLPDLDDESRKPTCSDGEAFTDLNPEMFKIMCPNVTTPLPV